MIPDKKADLLEVIGLIDETLQLSKKGLILSVHFTLADDKTDEWQGKNI